MKQQLELVLGGKKRKFTFGILFLGRLLERKEFDDYNDLILKIQSNPFKYTHLAMYESLLNTCEKYNKKIDFTLKDVIEWVEDDYLQGAPKFMQFVHTFLGTNDNKTPIEDNGNKEDSKKK